MKNFISSRILRFTRALACTCLCLSLNAVGQDKTPDPAPEKQPPSSDPAATPAPVRSNEEPTTQIIPPLSLEAIQAAVAEIESNPALTEEQKKRLLDQYKTASDLLVSAEKDEKSAEAYKKLTSTAGERLSALKDQLTQVSSTNTPALRIPEWGNKDADLEKLRNAMSQESSRLVALKSDQEKINASVTELQGRPERIAKQKLDTEASLATAESAIKSETQKTAGDVEGRARLTVLLAQRMAAQNRLNLLEQQSLSRDGETSINNIARELAIKQIARSEKSVVQMKEWIDAKAAAEAAAAEVAAKKAQQEAQLKHPAILEIASTNLFYATKLKRVIELNTALSKELADTQQKIEQTELAYTNLVRHYTAAGLSETLAKLLMSEEQELPQIADLRKKRNEYKNILTTNLLAHIVVNSRLDRLAIEDAEANRLLDAVDGLLEADKSRLLPDVLTLLGQQRETLHKLRDGFDRVEDYLRELDTSQHDRIELIRSFRTFIEQRLLWTPSVPPIQVADLQHSLEGLAYLTNPENWTALWLALKAVFAKRMFLSWTAVLLTLSIIVLHWKFTQFYGGLADQTRKIRTDSFSFTLRAAVMTVFELSPYYLVTRYFGYSLHELDNVTPFVSAFGFALARSIQLVMPFVLLMGICRPRGLGEEHFKWSKSSVVVLKSYALRYVAVGWTCFFVIGIIYDDKNSANLGGLPRVCYVISTLMLAYFVWRLFHSKTGRFWPTLKQPPQGLVQRARRVWFPFALLTPLSLAGLALAGYLYTGVRLNVQLNKTLYLLIFVLVLHQLAKRWFLVRQRKLALAHEIERRRAAAEAATEEPEQPGSLKIEIEDAEIDFGSIRTQTLELMKTAAGLAIIVGLWFIWASEIPALNYLDNFNLWQTTQTIAGTDQLINVTLADLLMVTLVLTATIVGYRNLPGLLEVVVLQNTSVRPGSRYAIKTLSQYALFVIGGSIVLTKLGVNWSQLGWMAAALSVGLGFGLQEVVANFVCGLLLFMERPIRVGDVVTVADVSGTVVRIQIRATTIMDWERREFIVPNKEFIAGRVLNWTLSNSINRLVIKTGVAYGTDTKKACELLVEAAKENPNTLADPPPFAIFEDFADSFLALTLRVYLPNLDNRLITQHDIRTTIDRKFKEAGIQIPFPQRDLHLRSVDETIDLRGAAAPAPSKNDPPS